MNETGPLLMGLVSFHAESEARAKLVHSWLVAYCSQPSTTLAHVPGPVIVRRTYEDAVRPTRKRHRCALAVYYTDEDVARRVLLSQRWMIGRADLGANSLPMMIRVRFQPSQMLDIDEDTAMEWLRARALGAYAAEVMRICHTLPFHNEDITKMTALRDVLATLAMHVDARMVGLGYDIPKPNYALFPMEARTRSERTPTTLER